MHVAFFSAFALLLSAIPRPFRAVYLYCYLAVLLTFGGFLGSVYTLALADGVAVSGGNLLYGAFMLTAVLFVLAERDVFVLRRIAQLVVLVNAFKLGLSVLASWTLGTTGVVNSLDVPADLFESSAFLIVLGGALIVLELTLMAFVFDVAKTRVRSAAGIRTVYLATFVAVLCLDGLAFPIIAFGPSPETVAAAVGSLSGKLLTALSYGLIVVVFSLIFPKRFAAFLDERVFSWRALLAPSSAILRDMERKDAQLSKAEARLAHSAELAGLGYAIVDISADRVVECDAAYAGMHGLDLNAFLAMRPSQVIDTLIAQEDRSAVRGLVEAPPLDGKRVLESRHLMPDGSVRSLRKIYAALPQGEKNSSHTIEVVGQDVTETRQLQEQLFRSQKADALGRLTGGVAHDFNNLLAVILGNLELLDFETDAAERRALIENCIAATRRGADLTRSMLSFAQQAPLAPKVIDVNDVLHDLGKMANRVIPATIEIVTTLGPDVPQVRVDPGMIESVTLNLVINARDAMPQGGRIEIKTATAVIEEADRVGALAELVPGPHLVLSVRDTGEGIPEEILEQVFEPFFTTKPAGSGSGLGLAMVDGFVRQSGGAVRVASTPRVGSTFELYFPAAEGGAGTGHGEKARLAPQQMSPSRKLLLVEDDADLRDSTRKTLTYAGYEVVTAADGETALAAFQASDEVDLVISDVILPGPVQGLDLIASLRAHRPSLPAVVISGNLSDKVAHADTLRPEDLRLSKPVSREDLLNAVRSAFLPSDN